MAEEDGVVGLEIDTTAVGEKEEKSEAQLEEEQSEEENSGEEKSIQEQSEEEEKSEEEKSEGCQLSALVFGATGAIGRALIAELMEEEKYCKVYPVGRRETKFILHSSKEGDEGISGNDRLQQIVVDYDSLSKDHIVEKGKLSDDVAITSAFCCLGTTIKKAGSAEAFKKVDYDYVVNSAKASRDLGVEHFSIVTSIGADKSSSMLYPKTKGEAEDALKKLKFPNLSIFRPSLLITDRNESRWGEYVAQMVMPAISWMFVGGFRKYREISVESVALALRTNDQLIHKKNSDDDAEDDAVTWKIFESDQIQSIADAEWERLKHKM
eukprot:TRINITY_DN6029_c0_g1_i1.p1 TRINITY_DN6029_c0_g1~~TRINITY_DN6029_c0_g1_i1.p1  ORF type:complete len:324 (-),score=91.47 TRINITY_DN6029_c0_g1_i1:31-1002(-)